MYTYLNLLHTTENIWKRRVFNQERDQDLYFDAKLMKMLPYDYI